MEIFTGTVLFAALAIGAIALLVMGAVMLSLLAHSMDGYDILAGVVRWLAGFGAFAIFAFALSGNVMAIWLALAVLAARLAQHVHEHGWTGDLDGFALFNASLDTLSLFGLVACAIFGFNSSPMIAVWAGLAVCVAALRAGVFALARNTFA